jgi:hypothetical protein
MLAAMDEIDPPSDEQLAKLGELQRKLREEPESARLRSDLLFAYCHPFFHGVRDRIDLIVWHVRNRPQENLMASPCASVDRARFPELYAEVEQAWEAALESDPLRPAVVRGAAHFLFKKDPNRVRTLLADAVEAHPEEAKLWSDLGGASETPAERLRCFQRARSLAEKPPNSVLLGWLCDAALDANDLPLATQYGRELLAESQVEPQLPATSPYGTRDARALVGDLQKPRGQRAYARHYGHTTLGLVALRTGDTAAALAHLQASAAVDGGPRLSSYGPSFELARELCERGFRDEVYEYLTACQGFWKDAILEQWCAELREGRVPSFE